MLATTRWSQCTVRPPMSWNQILAAAGAARTRLSTTARRAVRIMRGLHRARHEGSAGRRAGCSAGLAAGSGGVDGVAHGLDVVALLQVGDRALGDRGLGHAVGAEAAEGDDAGVRRALEDGGN